MVAREWRPRKASVVQPDMNVTPLVDVVLVLLIIFMVVAPRMEQDIPVTLPGIFNPDPDVDVQSPPIQVTVKDAGQYHIDGQTYDLDTAVATLALQHAADPYRRLDLRGDTKLKYKDVREIYGRVQQLGFPGLSLLASDLSHLAKTKNVQAAPAPAANVESQPAPPPAAAQDQSAQPAAAPAPAANP